jgi:hypothetical protein
MNPRQLTIALVITAGLEAGKAFGRDPTGQKMREVGQWWCSWEFFPRHIQPPTHARQSSRTPTGRGRRDGLDASERDALFDVLGLPLPDACGLAPAARKLPCGTWP